MSSILDILDEAKKKRKVIAPATTPKKKKKFKIVYIGNPNRYGISKFTTSNYRYDYNYGLRDKTHKKTILAPKYKIDANLGNYYWLVSKPYNKFALFSPQAKKLTDFIYT